MTSHATGPRLSASRHKKFAWPKARFVTPLRHSRDQRARARPRTAARSRPGSVGDRRPCGRCGGSASAPGSSALKARPSRHNGRAADGPLSSFSPDLRQIVAVNEASRSHRTVENGAGIANRRVGAFKDKMVGQALRTDEAVTRPRSHFGPSPRARPQTSDGRQSARCLD